ncbi:MAG: EAL domain-containing protein [Hyphomicrobiales bacterium]|nr:EAL domain-containing protein [Hyphomicrobiales bacterium]
MKIRQLLLLLFSALVLFPALTIGAWTYNQSSNTKFDEVREHHLLLAKNLSETLKRYYLDTKLIFEDISQNLINGTVTDSSFVLLQNPDFIDIIIIDTSTSNVVDRFSINNSRPPQVLDPGILKFARKWIHQESTSFSPVFATTNGTNLILLTKTYGNKIAIGRLKTDFFVNLGKSISFGEQGHAAIIDNQGNILAHPIESWIKTRKNIASFAPIEKILNKETGFQSYYSPELEAEMIAGFTHVDGPGWGVMIPRPVSELRKKSINTWKSYLIIIVASFAFAVILAVWISMRSTMPLLKLIAVNRNTDNPAGQKILPPPNNWAVPSEIKQLYFTHNEMIARLHAKNADTMRMAYSDMITGLPTREAFNKMVENEFDKMQANNGGYLLIFLDMDDFKLINDTMGHEAGDTVLSIVSRQITEAIAKHSGLDIVTSPLDENGNPIQKLNGRAVISRIGGDEFVALVPWSKDVKSIEGFLKSLSTTISSPYLMGDKEMVTSISMGASLFGRDGDNIRELTKKADIAMYWAKKSGKGNFCLFDKTVGERSPAEIQHDVATAIRNNEMILYYQPKINNSNGKATSVEAMVRWLHPEKGIIPPGKFIPVINHTGVADLLGEWVIRSACNQIKRWENAGIKISISVNIANHHLVSQNFLPSLLEIVDEVGVKPNSLEIEMTEETAMTAHKRAKKTIRALKENGFAVSLDDYGKGYSNLARLAALEIDVIKLDLSLISGITEDPRRAIIVASALDMARNLNCKTVAEGIETEEQANFISHMGCDFLQGFLFAKPMPVEELNIWMQEHSANNVSDISNGQSDARALATG